MKTPSRLVLALTVLPWMALALACPANTAPTTTDATDDADSAGTPDDADSTGPPDDADGAADTQTPLEAVRVVTLNLRCLSDDWDARLPIIADGLAAVDPDLVGLQEVCEENGVRDALTELIAALEARTGRRYTPYRAVTHRAWSTYDEGIAILSALPLEATQTVALPTGTFPRKVLLARVTRPAGGALVFATTHLDQLDTTTRKLQAEAVGAALDAFGGSDEARVLTGDLNEPPIGGWVHSTLVAAGLTDLWAALHPGDAGATFPARNPVDRIDYVWFAAGASGLAGQAIARILTAAVGGVTGSDHLGLAATLAR